MDLLNKKKTGVCVYTFLVLKADIRAAVHECSPDTINYLDHTLTTPAFQPLHCTLLEESWIALTAHSKLAASEVHYDGHVQVSLNACSHHIN